MTERDWAKMPYVRIYQSIKTDPKFATVYEDDRALAGWVRLLLDADAAYPARLAVPAHLSRHAKDVLTAAGILTVSAGTYAVSGLAKERGSRAMTAAERARAYRERLRRNGAVTDANVDVTTTFSRAPASVSDSSESLVTSPPAGAREADPYDEAVNWLASYRAWTDSPKIETELARMVDRKGATAVIAAMASVPNAETAAQFVYGARNALFPLAPSKVAQPSDDSSERFNRGVERTRREIAHIRGEAP